MSADKEPKYENEREIEEMTLLLTSLTSWSEKVRDTWSEPKAWKGYDFDILNRLEEQDFIRSSHRSKSITLTEKGLTEAERLKEKYLPNTTADVTRRPLSTRN